MPDKGYEKGAAYGLPLFYSRSLLTGYSVTASGASALRSDVTSRMTAKWMSTFNGQLNSP